MIWTPRDVADGDEVASGITSGRRWRVIRCESDEGPFVRVEHPAAGQPIALAAVDLRDVDVVIAALRTYQREYGPKSKRVRMSEALRARTLKCDDCGETADSTWTRPADSGRGVEWFGLCNACCATRERDTKRAQEWIDAAGRGGGENG